MIPSANIASNSGGKIKPWRNQQYSSMFLRPPPIRPTTGLVAKSKAKDLSAAK